MALVVIQTTVDSKKRAQKMARILVEKRAAACVQVLGPLSSIYRWKNKIEVSSEYLLQIKTLKSKAQAIKKLLSEIHSYETPEFLVFKVDQAEKNYADWARKACKH